MKIENVWEILGITEAKDTDSIVAAYKGNVVTVNPEDVRKDSRLFVRLLKMP